MDPGMRALGDGRVVGDVLADAREARGLLGRPVG